MTQKQLKKLDEAADGICRIDNILNAMSHTWKRGWIFGNRRPLKFVTGHGAICDRIALEPDEFDAFVKYLNEKRSRLQDVLDKG